MNTDDKIGFALMLVLTLSITLYVFGVFEPAPKTYNNYEQVQKKISLSDAQSFMKERCRDIGQTLMRTKTIDLNGTTMYAFMSVAENGKVCISTISEHKLEVLAVDCGEAQMKINQWNNF